MGLGGGTWTSQNKVLPGSYINFISAQRASSQLSDRGIVAMALEMDWGADGGVFTVEPADLQKNSLKIFGYAYTDEKLKGIRDLFKTGIRAAHLYRINSGTKAENTYATAKHSGIKGNDIKIVIAINIDDTAAFDVKTVYGTKEVDIQTVKTAVELIDSDYVAFKKDAELTATAGTTLTGGSNKAAITGDDYQTFLDKIESYSFNTLGCISVEKTVCDLFVAFTKRMRDSVGAKFQTVLYRAAADYEGVISVENKTMDAGYPESSCVYWVTGANAACLVSKSCVNKKYDGEFAVDAGYKQSELEKGIKAGKFMMHKVGKETKVLCDINTLVSFTPEKSEDFAQNQTMRVLDQIANDTALIFNTKYLGNVGNTASGRVSFWGDLVKHRQDLQKLEAIEDFKSEDVKVAPGEKKKAVVVEEAIRPTNAMEQLYMSVVVN